MNFILQCCRCSYSTNLQRLCTTYPILSIADRQNEKRKESIFQQVCHTNTKNMERLQSSKNSRLLQTKTEFTRYSSKRRTFSSRVTTIARRNSTGVSRRKS